MAPFTPMHSTDASGNIFSLLRRIALEDHFSDSFLGLSHTACGQKAFSFLLACHVIIIQVNCFSAFHSVSPAYKMRVSLPSKRWAGRVQSTGEGHPISQQPGK